jgi:hypothetical protein
MIMINFEGIEAGIEQGIEAVYWDVHIILI